MYEAFVQRESATFLGFFRRLGASFEEAEDLVQDVLIKLYRAADNYVARERFPAFAFRVARNAWIDAERSRAVRPKRAAGGAGDDDQDAPEHRTQGRERDPEELAVVREEHSRLESCLTELPVGHRQVFELGAIQELDYAEIGSILSIPVGTVKSRMFHAVRKLRAALAERDTEGVGR
ncbi:RNA polymerase sigma factor [Engelhardtia mirabilis]|uniref:ECF RNA polymerase sigma factor SigW n=1 Tax=Engelhardtia mirabilis TaxID=2528011 RepID=A0A518BKS5_9BACT|nr:ECF RNA polymerase sigma factor SigW [Planctomycetes bacterium Pla133]QDV01892.1 ECF RNA polymerase sigma factor SigW [Planctomycetes bacterium Pla86]